MEYRRFGSTDMRLSAVGLGGLLAHYWEGASGHPPPDEKRRIYLRAAEIGINLFDMGYGDEVHIPEELKGNGGDRYFSLKVGVPRPKDLDEVVEKHLRNLRRDALDILRVHRLDYTKDERFAERIAGLKEAGKVRSLCLIRHYRADQEAYAERGPEPEADADLVMYNYACRWQEPGIERSALAGKGVLVMKALGGQYLSWEHKAQTDWSKATEETVIELSPLGESIRGELDLIYSMVAGPWHELVQPGETIPQTGRAVRWVLENRNVSSALVAVASVRELEQAVQ